MKRETKEVRESDATVIRDVDGDEVWIYWADGRCAMGVASGENQDEPGKAVTLDAATLADVIAELSARLVSMLKAMPVQEQPAPQERPVSEMTREEIRTELASIWRSKPEPPSAVQIVNALNAIEHGHYLPDGEERTSALCARLHDLAQKAVTT